MREVSHRFESVTEWLAFLRTPVPNPELEQASLDRTRPSWAGTPNIEAALTLCENGWEDGLQQIETLAVELEEELVNVLHPPRVQYDVTGDMLDIDRFVNDEPEQFMSLVTSDEEQEGHPKILHLGCNIATSHVISTETIIRKGAAVAALVDALERQSRRVVIDLIHTVTSNLRYTLWVRIKESDAPLQLANLVFLIAHPSSLRRLGFLCAEHLPLDDRKDGSFFEAGNYGTPSELTSEEKEEAEIDIYIEGMRSGSSDWYPHQAVSWVLAKLHKQGIHAEREAKYG